MANVCENSEYIFGPKDQMLKLYDIFDELFTKDKNSDKNTHGVHSITYIIKKLGLEDLKLYSRCEIIEYNKDYDEEEDLYILSFDSYSAWNSMYETWDEILRIKFPDCKYAFLSIESGCGIYDIRDPYDRFSVLDYYVNIDISEPAELPAAICEALDNCGNKNTSIYDSWSESDVRKFVKDLCLVEKDIPTEDLLKLVEEWNESHEGIYVSIHPYQWIE